MNKTKCVSLWRLFIKHLCNIYWYEFYFIPFLMEKHDKRNNNKIYPIMSWHYEAVFVAPPLPPFEWLTVSSALPSCLIAIGICVKRWTSVLNIKIIKYDPVSTHNIIIVTRSVKFGNFSARHLSDRTKFKVVFGICKPLYKRTQFFHLCLSWTSSYMYV